MSNHHLFVSISISIWYHFPLAWESFFFFNIIKKILKSYFSLTYIELQNYWWQILFAFIFGNIFLCFKGYSLDIIFSVDSIFCFSFFHHSKELVLSSGLHSLESSLYVFLCTKKKSIFHFFKDFITCF